MNSKKILFILSAAFLFLACNPARKLNNDQYLLNKNTIIIDNPAISKEDLKTLIKQKPNRKILGLFRFHLWLYNLVDKEKTEKKKAEWIQKTEKKNETRRAQGKPEINTEKLIFREKLLNIGEEPAILDTTLTNRTRKQFQLYLFRNGYFNAIVSDTTIYKRNHKANIIYTIRCNQPYRLRNITFTSKDSTINQIVNNDKSNSLLHSGDLYNEDIIEKERERIANELRNQGYYFFNKNYITFFDADSSLKSNEVDIPLYVNRVNENVDHSLNLDLQNHHAYRLNRIFIQTDYTPKNPNAIPNDTVIYNDFYFLSSSGDDQFRKDALLKAIFFRHGELFQQKNIDYTYSRLLDLNVFKFIKIIFNEEPRDSLHENYLLDVVILLAPSPKQDYTIETEATHAGGNLGLAGSFGYRNKNMFRASESLEFRLKGSVEALRNFNDSNSIKKLFFFNTFEIGPEINLNIKRLLFFPDKRFSKSTIGRTNLSTSFNYQDRPDYTRRILNASFAWTWKQTATKTFAIYWADVNSVKVDLSQEFNNKLNNLSDLSLRNSYTTHLTPATRITGVFTDQLIKTNRNFYYFRWNVESAGNWLAPLVSNLMNEPTNSDGRKTITRIPYAQYVKPDVDISYHQQLNQHNVLVYRIALGWGIEGPNSTFLPFEKSFFGGGANSLRAWQARTLGPGSYKNTINIEQTGDMKFESNIEIRSSLFKVLEGAAFVDAGNIWTYHFDAGRRGSQFDSRNFINELAIGGGLGLRFNFSFFILRVDGAVKLHDPSLELNDRWVYSNQNFKLNDVTLNLAIGYPF